MQDNSKLLCLITASLVAGASAASAQAYDWNGPRTGWDRPAPSYERSSAARSIRIRSFTAPLTDPIIRHRARRRAMSVRKATATAL